MVSSFLSSSIVISTLLLLLSIIGPLTKASINQVAFTDLKEKAENNFLPTICQATLDPGFCTQSLSSDPRCATATLEGLSEISVDLAIASAKKTSAKIVILMALTTDLTLLERYRNCATYYDIAANNLQEAKDELNYHIPDYGGVKVNAVGASGEAVMCEKVFALQPPYPSPLSVENHNMQSFGDIIGVICDQLHKH